MKSFVANDLPQISHLWSRDMKIKLKILSSQARELREKTKFIQKRIKIDQILEFYQTQEAMAKAKNL